MFLDESAVKLSLQSLKNPYFYREQGLSSRNTAELKSDLEEKHKNVQGSLVVKVGFSNYNRRQTVTYLFKKRL